MYYVYKITLKNNYVYIGTTNNLKRRLHQHNENARKNKSFFGSFLNKNNIILKINNFEIIGEFENRKEAFLFESKNIKKYDNDGSYISLNIEKTVRGTRKGMNIGNTAKYYILIDIILKKHEIIYDVRQFEEKNDITRGCLHRTYNKNSLCKNRYKLFSLEKWNMLSSEEKNNYINGNFIKERNKNIIDNHIKRNIKKYKLLEKNTNKIIIVENLDKFAREHGMSSGTLHSTYLSGHYCKGYKVIERM